MAGISAVLSFVAVFKGDVLFSFLSGGAATISTILGSFEIGASKETKSRENEINKILSSLKIEQIVSESDPPPNVGSNS